MSAALLKFKHELLRWTPHICKVAGLDRLDVEDRAHGEFVLIAKWRGGGEFRQAFTRRSVMGERANLPPMQQAPKMRPCRFRDDFIRSILSARGL